ncbi:MAG TPA: CDP-glycerol glycerophosphotransferase family protein, partial [Eubacteriaceae bacterium]|nr:CDP-glycerol glycerophosphotransferase family protein [Eubacteriaceae bacterium]
PPIQYNAMRTVVEKTKVNPRKAIFESYGGRQYSCHPRAIYEYIQEHHPDMDCVWSVEPSEASTFKKMGIPYVKRFSPAWFFAMAKSKYWITNTRFPLWVEKPADTVYLQTWHGTPLKKLGMDIEEVFMPGTTTFQYKRNFYRESRNWDYLISPNRFSTNVFSRAYGLDREKIIESGSPRNDFLVNNKNNQTILEKIKRKRNLPTDKKIILYAPTWRDDEYFSKAKYRYNAALDLNKLKNALKDEYIVLLRMHYLVADNVDLTGVEDFAYNVSDGDITELYLISDLLITDYSSVYFDYAVLNRPMVFFMYDIDDYRDRLRGFYFDVTKHVPGPIVKDNDRLIEAIQNKDADNEKQKRFYQNFCALEDGNATKRVVEQIIG